MDGRERQILQVAWVINYVRWAKREDCWPILRARPLAAERWPVGSKEHQLRPSLRRSLYMPGGCSVNTVFWIDITTDPGVSCSPRQATLRDRVKQAFG